VPLTAQPPKKKWLVRFVQTTMIVLVVAGVAATLRRGVLDLDQLPQSVAVGWLVTAGLIYLLGLAPSALFWHRILVALDQNPKLSETVQAYYVGHLGKYVPGKALVVVIRTWLLRSERVDTAVVAVSVFLETLTMMAVGAFWGASILFVVAPHQRWLMTLAVLLMIAAGLPTVPWLFRRLVRVLPRIGETRLAALQSERLTSGLMVSGWLAISLGWVLIGLSLWATLRAMGVADHDPIGQLPLYTASVSLAVVAGFLSGIPGGAVVREGILWALLAQHLTEGLSLTAAVLLRLVWLLAELVLAAILLAIRPHHRRGS